MPASSRTGACSTGSTRRSAGSGACGARHGRRCWESRTPPTGAREMAGLQPEPALSLPRRALIVLCGPAGAGKRARLRRARGLLGRVPPAAPRRSPVRGPVGLANSPAQPVRPVRHVVGMRLSIGRPTVADGVNLHLNLRPRLLEKARAHGCPGVRVVFDVTLVTDGETACRPRLALVGL